MSRIWDALKEAEKQKARAAARDNPDPPPNGMPERRASQRQVRRIPLLVYGTDAEKQPFHEEVYTLEVNDRGCLMSLETEVSLGQRLILTNTHNMAELEASVVKVGRRVQGRMRAVVQFLRPDPQFWLDS